MTNRRKNNGDEDKRVGQLMRELRDEQKITREALAKFISKSGEMVRKYETGASRPATKTMRLIAEFLGVAPSHFYKGQTGSQGDEPMYPRTSAFTELTKHMHLLNDSDQQKVVEYAGELVQLAGGTAAPEAD